MQNEEVRYAVLGSGSEGNAYIIENSRAAILIDNGYRLNELYRRLNQAGFEISKLKYIFLTHDHSDHSSGVAELALHLNIPVVMHHKAVIKASAGYGFERWNIKAGKFYSNDYYDLNFTAFDTSHDSPFSLGYFIELSGRRFLLITDTGRLTPCMYDYAESADVLFLESNYSPVMLQQGKYPAFLKARIAGARGHLSNYDAANFIIRLSNNQFKRIFLCHLSQNNNSIETLKEEFGAICPLEPHITICPRNQLMAGEFYAAERADKALNAAGTLQLSSA
ncbi:MAG: MBL fold metallo-hydrolase [Spirochaetaceae bacterium]|nr:MBL fold metallo-hydrolase [Spirochaetaceae bacterium]